MMLIIFFFAVAVAILGTAAVMAKVTTGHALPTSKKKAITSGPRLSEVAKQVKREYLELPKDSRPIADIDAVLTALDVSTGANPIARRRHFDDNWLSGIGIQNGSFSFVWRKSYGNCSHNSARYCEYAKYYHLHQKIEEVKKALEEKEIRIRLASVDTDSIKELEDGLRREAKLQRDITRELL